MPFLIFCLRHCAADFLITSRERDLAPRSSRSLLSASPQWYFCHFRAPPSFPRLRAKAIDIGARAFITKTWFQLFLTASQARYLRDLADLHPVSTKLVASIGSAEALLLETSSTFDPASREFAAMKFSRLSDTAYSVTSPDLEAAANVLSRCGSVYAISPARRPEIQNRIASGYSQNNTQFLNPSGDFPRYFESKGITGRGVTVTVLDTWLDPNSTFFYDPTRLSQNATLDPLHRKIVYNAWHIERPSELADHGTHVSGTIAGRATCDSCPASRFNGVAPDAKLAFRGWLRGEEWLSSAATMASLMDLTNSSIVSNSWASGQNAFELQADYDRNANSNPDKLYVFSAANSGENRPGLGGYYTVPAPGACKNILAIGALNQLQIRNVPTSPRVYLVETWLNVDKFMVNATRLEWSSDPFGPSLHLMQGTVLNRSVRNQFVAITNASELDEFSENPAAVFVHHSLDHAPVGFPVFLVADEKMWDVIANTGPVIRVLQEYREVYDSEPRIVSWSSRGPTLFSILKPEVVAPGVALLSARAIPGGPPNHESIISFQGTSMSCPNVAGALALVQQYISDRLNLRASASLLRATIVAAADPLPSNSTTPNCQYGFGQVNLAPHLPFGEWGIHVVNHRPIGRHLVSTVNVTARTRELRVVIAWADQVGSTDSVLPLLDDLDLIVVSPSGRVFRGNQRPDHTEEHFSTIERVIVPANETELGEYRIHVIPSLYEADTNFSAVIIGSFAHATDFQNATRCATPCGSGSCDQGTFECKCPTDKAIGQSCQVEVVHVDIGQDKNVTVAPLGVAYVAFVKGEGVARNVELVVEVPPLSNFSQLYVADGQPAAVPREYEPLQHGQGYRRELGEVKKGKVVWAVLIRNDAANPAVYPVRAAGEVEKEVEKGLTVAQIAGISVGTVVVIAAIAIVAAICFRRKRRDRTGPLLDNEIGTG